MLKTKRKNFHTHCSIWWSCNQKPAFYIYLTPDISLPKVRTGRCTKIDALNCSDPTCGGRNYILKWVFFCSDNFGRSIFWAIIVEKCECIIKKLVQRRIRNSKDFFLISSISYRGLKFCVNT